MEIGKIMYIPQNFRIRLKSELVLIKASIESQRTPMTCKQRTQHIMCIIRHPLPTDRILLKMPWNIYVPINRDNTLTRKK